MASTNSPVQCRARSIFACALVVVLPTVVGTSVRPAVARQAEHRDDSTTSPAGRIPGINEPVPGGLVVRARTLKLRTNVPDALVFIDSELVGRAREGTFRIEPDAHLVQLTAPTLGAWSIEPVSSRLPRYALPSAPDTVEVELTFPHHYYINSDPYGAEVQVRTDSLRLVGRTPVRFAVDGSPASEIVLSLDGYRAETWVPTTALWNRHVASLDPAEDGASSVLVSVDEGRRWWIDALSIVVAGAGAATAVHYKFKADRRYDVYSQTGDPSLRPEIRRLDTRSAVGLGVMQAGLALFAIRMVLD